MLVFSILPHTYVGAWGFIIQIMLVTPETWPGVEVTVEQLCWWRLDDHAAGDGGEIGMLVCCHETLF